MTRSVLRWGGWAGVREGSGCQATDGGGELPATLSPSAHTTKVYAIRAVKDTAYGTNETSVSLRNKCLRSRFVFIVESAV